MKLNSIKDNAGSKKSRIRVGRGIGSGKGKTGGRGGKGQTTRSGVAINGFEGGQMPLHMRMPKRGFRNIFKKRYQEVNLDAIQTAIDSGKLNAQVTVDAAALIAAGVIRRAKDGVRVLGNGKLKSKVSISAAAASGPAKAAIEAAVLDAECRMDGVSLVERLGGIGDAVGGLRRSEIHGGDEVAVGARLRVAAHEAAGLPVERLVVVYPERDVPVVPVFVSVVLGHDRAPIREF